jgi:heterodisulfide reductase subunit A-like polyferredoxin
MIQCVGSRNEKRPYCSRTCCTTALKNAISMKKRWPDTGITIMFRDMMTYGFLERYYTAARKMGIRFVRFAPEDPPVVEARADGLSVRCLDTSLCEVIERRADRLVLSAAAIPNDTGSLAGVFKLPRTREGFFHEAHMKLKPIDFAADGLYMAGSCHSPKNIREGRRRSQGCGGHGRRPPLQRIPSRWAP